jgi:urocanate hydratase
VADEIRLGRCLIKELNLISGHRSRFEATDAVKAIASAIQMDCNLESLLLRMENGFTDEAGVALAEALTINKTLRKITLSSEVTTFGAQVYEAFSAMMRVNTGLIVELPQFKTHGADERLLEARNQMIIEQQLNQAGRGKLLSSSLTTREEYVDALHMLSSNNVDDSPTFRISCLYSLLRLKPSVACML